MSSSNLMRWSGLAALVGGGLLVVVDVVWGLLFPGSPEGAEMASSGWIILNMLELLLLVLISLGLVGIYVCQAEQAGVLGLIGFLVFFLGTAMMSGALWSLAFILPWLAVAAPPELLNAEPSGVVIVGFLLTLIFFGLGGLLFGLASLRAGVLPRGAVVLLMVGAVLGAMFDILDLPFSAVVFAAAVAWMGYSLWSGTARPAATTFPSAT